MKKELEDDYRKDNDSPLQIKKAKPLAQMKIGINIKGSNLTSPSPKPSSPQGLTDGGKFGWTTFSDVDSPIPYIFTNGVKYVSKRIVTNTVLSTYPHFPEEIFQCLKIDSKPLTESESQLLNEINFRHCDSQFGAYAFSSTSDMKIPLEDFEKAHEFYLFAKRILYEKEMRQECCGFLIINKDSYVPFVRRGSLKLLPNFYFEGESDLAPIAYLELSRWEMNYLRLLCQVQQIKKLFFSGPTCKVMELEDIKKLFSANATFEEAWPNMLIKQWANDQLSKSKNNMNQNNQAKENLTFFIPAPQETRTNKHVPTSETIAQPQLKEFINISNPSNSRIKINALESSRNLPPLQRELGRKRLTPKHLILRKGKPANFGIIYPPKSTLVSSSSTTENLNMQACTRYSTDKVSDTNGISRESNELTHVGNQYAKNNTINNNSINIEDGNTTSAGIGIIGNGENTIINADKPSNNQSTYTLKSVANPNKLNTNKGNIGEITKDQRNITNPNIVNNIIPGINHQATQKVLNKNIPNVLQLLKINNPPVEGNKENSISTQNKNVRDVELTPIFSEVLQPDNVPPSGRGPTLVALKMSKDRNIIKINENSLPEFLAKNPHLEVSKIALTPEQAKTFDKYYNINSTPTQAVLQSQKPSHLQNKSQLNEAKDPTIRTYSQKLVETEEYLRQPIPKFTQFSPLYTVLGASVCGKKFKSINLRPHRLNSENKILISTHDIGAEFFPTKYRGDIDEAMKLAGLSLYKLSKSQEAAFEKEGKIVGRTEMFVLADQYIYQFDKIKSLVYKS